MFKITSNFNSSQLSKALKTSVLNLKIPCPHCKKKTISIAKAGNTICRSCNTQITIKK